MATPKIDHAAVDIKQMGCSEQAREESEMCAWVDVNLKIQDLTPKVHPGPYKLRPTNS